MKMYGITGCLTRSNRERLIIIYDDDSFAFDQALSPPSTCDSNQSQARCTAYACQLVDAKTINADARTR